MPRETLPDTAYVILGFLAARPRSGYEIKQAVDNSTRFFWAASYGQIYPVLRRLADAGLVASEADDAGERKRSRHRITAAGRRELRRWLATPGETTELRDENLLKLFFAGAAGGDDAAHAAGLAALAARGERHAETAERLRELEPRVLAAGDDFQLAVLRYGIELNEWGARHCDRAAEAITTSRQESA